MDTKYVSDNQPFYRLRGFVKLPPFQRSVVWSEDKKQNFIDTVLKGLPFGSLLLYKESPTEYLLVDGLQRYTTLDDFENNPCKYINIESQCKTQLNDLIDALKAVVNTNFNEFRISLISSIKRNLNLESDAGDIANNIILDFPIFDTDNKCYRELLNLINSIKTNLDISKLQIPCIYYNGSLDDLPDIFERMNANGTQLSKYEIYAAKWSNIQFEYHDTEILQLIDEKYQNMIDKTGVEICNYQDGQIIREQKINLFEFCFAFGKLLQKNAPHIIFDRREFNKSDVASIGFTLLTVILSGSTSSMNSMSRYFKDMDSHKTKNLNLLKDKILSCVKSVQRILMPYVIMSDNKTPVTKYIEHQMICIISTLFKIRYSVSVYDFSATENKNNSKLSKAFETNMPKRYLYDILSEYWSGSGDTKISEELSKNLSDNRYLTNITLSTWEQLLHNWMLEQTQKPMKKIPIENKLFLNYLFKLNESNNKYSNYNKPLNFEYIVSKDRFQKTFKDSNGLSAIGNLCILPQFETRSKQEYTLYESIRKRSTLYEINIDALSDFLYPEESELTFVYEDFIHERYLVFIKNRHQYLINIFKKLISTSMF